MKKRLVLASLLAACWLVAQPHAQDYYKAISSLIFGGGSTVYTPSGVLCSNTTPVSNVGTAETDLQTCTLSAGSLNTTGRGIRISGMFTTAANANIKTMRVYFGATVLAAPGGIAVNATPVMFTAIVLRTAPTTQIGFGWGQGAPGPTSVVNDVRSAAPAETLANAIVIKTTGLSGTASNDVTSIALVVEALP